VWWRPSCWFIGNCTCRFNTLKKYPGCKPEHPHYVTFVSFEVPIALLLIPFIWDMTLYNWVSVSSIVRQHSSLIFKGQGIILDRHLNSWKWSHYIVMKHHKLFTQWHIIISQKNGFLRCDICFCVKNYCTQPITLTWSFR